MAAGERAMNEPLLHPDRELVSMRKRADYYEWLLSRMRQFVREHLEVDDRDFPLWLAHKTALEGVPDNDEIPTTQRQDNQHTDKRIS